MHRAESVIAAVVTRVTGLATTGARVYRGRTIPLAVTEQPALLVYMGDDVPIGEYSQSLIDCELTVFLEARVRSPTAQLDTDLTRIREEVTIALHADYTQGLAYVLETVEGEASAPELSGDGEQPIGSQRMEWKFHYRRSRTNPGA